MDPLAQLNDIHLPAPISQYPLALGWWLLALFTIVALVAAVVYWRRHQKQRKVRNIAIKQLQQNTNMSVEETLLLIKWVALAYFPRSQCANLYGKKLQQFLLTTLPEKIAATKRQQFIEQLTQCAQVFERVYHKDGHDIVDDDVNQLALIWLKTALPPRAATIETLTKPTLASNAIKEELS